MKRWRWKSNFRTTLCWIWCGRLSCPFGGLAGDEFGLGVVEQDTQRTLLGDSGDSELSTALLRQAQRRGLPLALPLLDLQDTMQVSPGIVWEIFANLSGCY